VIYLLFSKSHSPFSSSSIKLLAIVAFPEIPLEFSSFEKQLYLLLMIYPLLIGLITNWSEEGSESFFLPIDSLPTRPNSPYDTDSAYSEAHNSSNSNWLHCCEPYCCPSCTHSLFCQCFLGSYEGRSRCLGSHSKNLNE